jgi:hypothetical protein
MYTKIRIATECTKIVRNESLRVQCTSHNAVIPFYKLTDMPAYWLQNFQTLTNFCAFLFIPMKLKKKGTESIHTFMFGEVNTSWLMACTLPFLCFIPT